MIKDKKGKAKMLEFHISYNCVNKCLFCSEAHGIVKNSNSIISSSKIKKVLVSKKKDGYNYINFTGGEPTVHPQFLEILSYAKFLNYKTYIGTNGFMTKDKNFCVKILPFLDEISFSIHGDSETLHDKLVGRIGAHKDITESLKNITKFGFENKCANIVVVKENFETIKNIVSFLSKNSFKRVIISNLAPEGAGLDNYNENVLSFRDWKKIIPDISKIAETSGMIIKFFGLPMCILKDSKLYSNDFMWDARTTVEIKSNNKGVISLGEITNYFPNRARKQVNKCEKCKYNEVCFGVFDKYLEICGDDLLEPII